MKPALRNLITLSFISAALLIAFLLILLVMGIRPFILVSASMEPTIPQGSLVFVRRTGLGDLSEGDVIVYRSNGTLVLHRYLGNNLLQGDANSVSQTVKLSESNYVGKEIFFLPGMGSAVSALLSRKWILWLLLGIFLVIACARAPGKDHKHEQ